VLAAPFVLYQVWLFIAPGLYKHERKAVTGFLFSTVLLFLAGISFGYFIMLPYMLDFLTSFQGPFRPLISINEYFDFILIVLLGLGVIFEMPVLIFFLALFGIVTPKFLWKNLRYAILIIAVVAAIITPTPDATTMLIFMAPMVALYFLASESRLLVRSAIRQNGLPWPIKVRGESINETACCTQQAERPCCQPSLVRVPQRVRTFFLP
jgi:sec-independent protein translocase protein TatC